MKTVLKLLFFVIFLSFSLNPGPVLAEKSVAKYAKKIKVERDDFDGTILLTSSDITTLLHDPYYVRTALFPKDGNVYHLVVVEYDFLAANPSGRKRYASDGGGSSNEYKEFVYARDPDDTRFDIRQAGRGFTGCDSSFCHYSEYFAIVVDDSYLRSKAEEGIKLRALSRAGVYIDLMLPANYVKAIILRLDEEKAKLGID